MWQGDRGPRRPLRWALSGAMDLCGVGASIQNGNAANAPQLIAPTSDEPASSGSSLPTLVVQKKGLRVKYFSSAVSGLAVIVALGAPFPHAALATPTFVQGTAFSTARLSSYAIPLTRPVAQGDLLVGWFSQYNAPEQVQVSDNVNGAWTRAVAGSLTFDDDTGDIALYYRENSRAAPGGLSITVSVSATAYLQGSVAEYSGVALAGSLHSIAAAHGNESTVVDTGATAPVDAGELVFAALVAESNPGTITPGLSQGVRYTRRAPTSTGSDYAEDITSSAAGPQHGTATFTNAVEWSAVCAVFHPYPTTPPVPPSTPTGLHATSVASTRVALSWSQPVGSVAGYTVYRDGTAIGTSGPDSTIFLDPDVLPATIHTYTVNAFDLANDHSAQSASLTVATPSQSIEFVQGAADSPASRLRSGTLNLRQ